MAGNTTITGSALKSQTGDIDITSRNDTTINASKIPSTKAQQLIPNPILNYVLCCVFLVKICLENLEAVGSASGAVAGVVGEVVGSQLRDSVQNGLMQRETAVQLSGLAGSAASLATSIAIGIAIGLDDSSIAKNIFAGQNSGWNCNGRNWPLPFG